MIGFAQFRFSFQGELFNAQAGEPSLFVYDVQLQPTAQRMGLGRHLMLALELVARKQKMSFMQILVPEVWEKH